MSKYFKLAWSGNIFKNEISRFNKSVEAEFGVRHSDASAGGMAVGDFNGDGNQDILTTYSAQNYDGGHHATVPSDGQIILLLGTSKGTFKDGTDLLAKHGRTDSVVWTAPTVGDFNGDGVDDVVLAGSWEDGRITEFDGPEHRAHQIALMSSPDGPEIVDLNFKSWGRSSSAGDFNNDGLEDFIVDAYSPDVTTGEKTCFYFQNVDGSFTQKWPEEGLGSNFVETGDFDGDGDDEIADFITTWGPDGPTALGMRVHEVNADGTFGEVKTVTKPIERLEEGISWSGGKTFFAISKDQFGNDFIDLGVHFATTGDVNGDGKDDIVGSHLAIELNYNKNGVLTENGADSYGFLEIFSMTDNGLEATTLKLRGWTPTKYNAENIDLMDWNGDGHLDIFVPVESVGKGNRSEGARLFLNDGTGNFDRMPQKFIPAGTNRDHVEIANAIDANGDGVMDLLMRPRGFSDEWNDWGKASEMLYLGKRVFGDGTTHNPAKDGAAGFNEAYYLNQIESSSTTLKANGYQSGLEHYLSVGKENGAFGFAAGTHVYGYQGSETIALREGNETVHAFGGDDVIIGGAGADTLSGGKGSDTFVYRAVTDSGVTATKRDIIRDFESGTDRIDLSTIDAIAGTVSNDAFSFLSADGATFAGHAGELRWYSTGSGADAGRILEGDVDGDAVADFQIELLSSGTVNAADLAL